MYFENFIQYTTFRAEIHPKKQEKTKCKPYNKNGLTSEGNMRMIGKESDRRNSIQRDTYRNTELERFRSAV